MGCAARSKSTPRGPDSTTPPHPSLAPADRDGIRQAPCLATTIPADAAQESATPLGRYVHELSRRYRALAVQSCHARPRTRANSERFAVTSVAPVLSAWAAINRS